jgi:hypothetical protein
MVKPFEADPSFLKSLEAKYGPIDMENDFFSNDLSTYYKTIEKGDSINHKIIRLANFNDSFIKLYNTIKAFDALENESLTQGDEVIVSMKEKLKNLFNVYRTHIRKNYPFQYSNIKKEINEYSVTGGGASFSDGPGEQYAVPFNKEPIIMKKFKYKLSEKFLKEEEATSPAKKFQQRRIAAFDIVEKELNEIYKLLDTAKDETIQFYNTNPQSYLVHTPTDMILDYLKDIKELLNPELK